MLLLQLCASSSSGFHPLPPFFGGVAATPFPHHLLSCSRNHHVTLEPFTWAISRRLANARTVNHSTPHIADRSELLVQEWVADLSVVNESLSWDFGFQHQENGPECLDYMMQNSESYVTVSDCMGQSSWRYQVGERDEKSSWEERAGLWRE